VDGGSTRDPKATDPIQHHQVTFGCCSQASSEEYVEGHCAPKSTYSFEVFNKVEDKEKSEKIKTMVGDQLIACKSARITSRQSNLKTCCHSTTKEETSNSQRKSGCCLIAI
jgi:hypothetical protein